MALYGYFDETGHPRDPKVHTFAIVGCIGTAEGWGTFEAEWSALLADEHVEWFHARELWSQQGVFRGWTAIRRQSFFDKACEVINRSVGQVVGFAKHLSDDRRRLRAEYLDLHKFVVLQTIATTHELTHFIFARHPEVNPLEDHRIFRDAMRATAQHYEKIGDLTLSDPRTSPPLQAADLIAAEFYRWDNVNPRLPAAIRVPFIFRWAQ